MLRAFAGLVPLLGAVLYFGSTSLAREPGVPAATRTAEGATTSPALQNDVPCTRPRESLLGLPMDEGEAEVRYAKVTFDSDDFAPDSKISIRPVTDTHGIIIEIEPDPDATNTLRVRLDRKFCGEVSGKLYLQTARVRREAKTFLNRWARADFTLDELDDPSTPEVRSTGFVILSN